MDNQTTAVGECKFTEGAIITSVFVTFFALPFHLLMMKILYKNCEMTLPRHKIMISLTASDALQIFASVLLSTFQQIFSVTQYREAACRYLQAIAIFFLTLTLFVSSMSITSLSIERYISCIYSLHVYEILATKRMAITICMQWVIGTALGVISVCLHNISEAPSILTESVVIHHAIVLIIFPSATVITLIQLRLYFLSRSKLARVKPVGAFGKQAEMIDLRKRQVKITFVASIVAIAYIVCMFPMAIVHAYEWQNGMIKNNSMRSIINSFLLINTLIDPFIYGLGIEETRKLIWKDMKAAKNLLLWHLFKVSSD